MGDDATIAPALSPEDDRAAVDLYFFATNAFGAPDGERYRAVVFDDRSVVAYVSNLLDEYTFSRARFLFSVIKQREEEHNLVQPLERAYDRLERVDESPPTLKELFDLCWPDEKYILYPTKRGDACRRCP